MLILIKMKTTIHQKIVKETFEEYKDLKNVIGIVNFGSVAIGKERKDSDVDIYIVFKNNVKWNIFREKRHGIKVDFEVVGKKDFLKYTKKYPYLYYFQHDKILLDKDGTIKQVFDHLRNYFKKNKKVNDFWKDEYKIMRDKKKKGEREKHFAEVCDEAEKRFSPHHSIKRKILTKNWFNKHDN